MSKPLLLKESKVFYGYWIVAATFVLLFTHSGFGFYAFSLFVKPLEAQFGWSRGGIMVAFTVYFIAQSVAAPIVGRMIDRYGARRIIAVGAIVSGLGFVLLSQTHTLWFFYLSYAIFGAGHVTSGHVPVSAIVSNWFKKRRGTAIGVAGVGIGVGGLVVAPLMGGYLIPSFGWRISYLVLAVLTWVITIPIALFVIKTKPSDMGLYPDGIGKAEAETAAARATSSASDGLTLRMALATSAFWLIAVSFLANSFGNVGILQNQVPFLEGIGFPIATAAGALGAVGLGSAVGKFGFGWLCDRISPKYAGAIGLILMLVGTIILLNVGPLSPPVIIWLYAIIMGLGVGSWLPTMSLLTSKTFGLISYGAIWGLITGIHGIGTALGPVVLGYIYDKTGSYNPAFILVIIIFTVAMATVLAVRHPKSS